jgi:hypothetical protein
MFLHPKVDIFVPDIGCKAGNLNVQPSNLLLRTLKLEGPVNSEASGWCRPWFPSNILAGITEEVEIGEEGIFNHLIPVERLSRWH